MSAILVLAVIIWQPVSLKTMTMKTKLTVFLLTFLVSNFSFGQKNLENFKVDTTITGFHFAADFQGTKVFTKNGPSDIQTINPTAFSFTIAPNSNSAEAKEQLKMMLTMSKQNGFKISDFKAKDTTLSGNNAYYISYTETDNKSNYKNIVFNSFVVKDKKTFYSMKL
jgi:hypothetical protein